MRVTLVTQWFPPEPAAVPAGYADGLSARGHEVHVLTGFPNYPSGKLIDGYRIRPYLREQRDSGVVVHRAPLFPSHDASVVRRAGNYLSFAGAAALVAQRLPHPDVWLTYSSPITATAPAMLARRLAALRGWPAAPHAQVIQDLWPDSVTGSGLLDPRAQGILEATLGRYCRASYRDCAAIGVISPSMRSLLASRGVPDHVVWDTPNWVADPGEPTQHPALSSDRAVFDVHRDELGLPRGRLFVYAGNLGEVQALDELVSAFARRPQAQLVLMGHGVARRRLQELVSSRALTNVHILEPRTADRVGAVLDAADALVVSLADTPLLRATMPSKVASCLAAGRPVLAQAAGDVAAIINASRAGVAVSPRNPDGVADAVESLANAPAERLAEYGRAARSYYRAHLTEQVGLDALERLLTHCLRTNGSATLRSNTR